MVIVMRIAYYPGTQLSSSSQKWLCTLKNLRGEEDGLVPKTASKCIPGVMSTHHSNTNLGMDSVEPWD